jgi:hypothetical protein
MIGLTLVALTVLPLIGCGNDDGESAQEPVTVAVEGTRQGVDGLTDRDRARARRIVMGDPELRELVPNRVRDEVRVSGPTPIVGTGRSARSWKSGSRSRSPPTRN